MNPLHHDPDARVDQILTALNTAEVPGDLAQRLHRSLQQSSPRNSSLSAHSSFRAVFQRWLPATALSMAAAIIALIFITTHHASPAQPQPKTITDAPTHNAAPARASATTRERQSRPPYQPGTSPQVPSPPGAEGLTARPVTTADQQIDALALAETHAPSLPLPTLPLTADERLMQTIVRRTSLPQFAELAPPSPLPPIAPMFAGFASRSEADEPTPDPDSDPTLAIDNENQ